MKKINGFCALVVVGGMLSMVNAQAASVARRQVRQQHRIAQGVNSGQLTAGETARLEGREARVHNEVKRDRAANDGHLTPGEHARVTHQQNRISRSIYRDKHNAAQR